MPGARTTLLILFLLTPAWKPSHRRKTRCWSTDTNAAAVFCFPIFRPWTCCWEEGWFPYRFKCIFFPAFVRPVAEIIIHLPTSADSAIRVEFTRLWWWWWWKDTCIQALSRFAWFWKRKLSSVVTLETVLLLQPSHRHGVPFVPLVFKMIIKLKCHLARLVTCHQPLELAESSVGASTTRRRHEVKYRGWCYCFRFFSNNPEQTTNLVCSKEGRTARYVLRGISNESWELSTRVQRFCYCL